MKHNTFINVIIIVLLSVCFCSCKKEQTSNNTPTHTEQAPSGNKDTTKQVEPKIEDLLNKLNNISKETESLKADKKQNEWCIHIAWGISFFSLIIAILSIVKVYKFHNRLDRHRNTIKQLREEVSDLNFKPQQQVRSTSNSVSRSEFSTLASKVANIENIVKNNVTNANNRDINKGANVHKNEPKEISKIGYFGPAVSGEGGTGYFKKLLDSIEDARVKASIIGNSATYEPTIPLNTIKSSDWIDLAVDFEGVSKNEATSMAIKHKGYAEKKGDKWIIINKAVVTLN